MTVDANLKRWLNRQSPELAEWMSPCRSLFSTEEGWATCLGIAKQYESKGISTDEFLAALGHLTNKTLNELEEVLGGNGGQSVPQVDEVRQTEQPGFSKLE